jgi:drug/metabolite transporter (DMT)-like permease
VTAAYARRAPFGLYVKLVLVAALWGGMYSAGRIVAQLLPHFTTATLRFAVASTILLALAFAREGGLPRLDRRRLATMLVLGFTGVFLFNAFFFAALERIEAGRGALIMALTPATTAVGARLAFGERLGSAHWLGIAVALGGAGVVITRGEPAGIFAGAVSVGDLMMFGAALCWVAYTLLGRSVLRGMSPLGATTWAALFGTAMLAACAAFEQPWAAITALSAKGWWAVAYLGSFGTVFTFLWYYQGVQRLGPSRAAIFTNFVPVFGVAIAAALLGEPILASMIVGGVLVIAGVALTNRPRAAAL